MRGVEVLHSAATTTNGRRYLQSNPPCAACMKEGLLTPATVVDHIIPHRGDQRLFWDEHSWQPLCKSCHDRKTGGGE